MVVISRFRSLWGVEPGPQQSEWKQKFIEWKAHGYGTVLRGLLEKGHELTMANAAGIEIDFAGMSPEELQLLRSICDEVGLETSVTFGTTTSIGLRQRLIEAACSHPGRNTLAVDLLA
jgi:hypothetical protein